LSIISAVKQWQKKLLKNRNFVNRPMAIFLLKNDNFSNYYHDEFFFKRYNLGKK